MRFSLLVFLSPHGQTQLPLVVPLLSFSGKRKRTLKFGISSLCTFKGTWNCAGALVLWSDDVKFCLSHALILKFAFLLVCSKDKDNNFFCWHDSSDSVPSSQSNPILAAALLSPPNNGQPVARTLLTYCVKILLLIGSPLGERE